MAREILTGLSVIRAFGREKKEEQRFDDANRDLTKTMLFTNRVMTFMMPGMMMIMNVLTVGIVWFGAHKIDQGTMQVHDGVYHVCDDDCHGILNARGNVDYASACGSGCGAY